MIGNDLREAPHRGTCERFGLAGRTALVTGARTGIIYIRHEYEAQAAVLRTGRLYVQIDSETAPI